MTDALEAKALAIPEGLDGADEQVLELIRVWWNVDGPRMNIRPALREPANMGVVLAELAWHFSHAYAEMHGFDQPTAFKAIRDSWDAAHEKAAASQQTEPAQ